jgi:hypothetical protein
MTERLHQPAGSGRRTRTRTPRPRAAVRTGRTIPTTSPAEFHSPLGAGDPDVRDVDRVAPPPAGLVSLRRPDALACAGLVLAGVAANASLLLPWSPGNGPTGLALVEGGVRALSSGVAAAGRTGAWQPLTVVVSGGLLVLLGMLLLVPARTHRLVGLLSLGTALAAAVAVTYLLAGTGWRVEQFGPGLWCAVAVPVFGVVGALKAMLTPPLVALREPTPLTGAPTD